MSRKKYITDEIDIFNAEGGVSTEIGYDPFNILTWQLSPNTFSVAAEDTSPEELFFKPDGSKMYVLGRSGDDIGEYALSTPWDITTATYTGQLSGLNASPSNEGNPYGLFISPDGINIYITGFDRDQVIQWFMSTPWDITSGRFVKEKDLLNRDGSSFSNPNAINFKEDGLQMFVQSYSEDIIINYTLSTAWDISELTYTSELSLLNIYDPSDLAPDGSNFSLSTANSFRFNTAGTVMIIADSSKDSLFQIDLTTAWDITTAVFFSGLYRSSSYESSINGLFLSQNAYKVFTVGSTDRVREINTGGTLFNSLNDTSVGFDSGLNVEGNVTIARDLSVGTFNTTSASNLYGSLTTHTTTQLAHSNGGTVRILDGNISTGRSELKIMTNSGWGTNNSNQGQQYTERTNTLNLARPYGGALVQVNIGSVADAAGTRVPHSGIVEIDSKAQTFNHSGSFSVGKTIQVEGNYDYETLSIPGTSLGFNDTFTARTTVELTSHTPDLGGSWVNVLTYPGATNTRTMQVKARTGYMQSSGSDRNSEGLIYMCGTAPTSVNYDVKATFYRQDNNDDVVHLIIKYVNNDNYYFLTWGASYGQTELRKKENGVVTTVSAIHPDDPFKYGVNNNTSDGSNVTLRIRFINSSIMVWNSGTDDNGVVEEFFRGTFPVTGDFNDGDRGKFHAVAFGIGSINTGDSYDLTDEWKISQFELYNLPPTFILDDSTVSYINTGSVGIGTTEPEAKLDVRGDLKMKEERGLTHYLTMSPIKSDVYINKDLNNTVFFGDNQQPSTTNISVAADIESRGGGLVLTSPKGVKFRITVDDRGRLISSPV